MTIPLHKDELIDKRYRVLSSIGQGGHGTVYLAKHVHLDRLVALKILSIPSDESAIENFRERFRNEGLIISRLNHPNIVRFFDFGFMERAEHDVAIPYIVIEYLEGRDLSAELLLTGAMSRARALRLMDGVLSGLSCGQRHGIIHKDIKPQNLFLVSPLAPEERLVILDYGIARIGNEPASELTMDGTMTGTPRYMAPEYIERREVTPAIDVYQSALVLVEMLIGRPVVREQEPLMAALAHYHGRLDIPEDLLRDDLGPVLKKGLARKPEDRFPDPKAFRDALREVSMRTMGLNLASMDSYQSYSGSIERSPDTPPEVSMPEPPPKDAKASSDTTAVGLRVSVNLSAEMDPPQVEQASDPWEPDPPSSVSYPPFPSFSVLAETTFPELEAVEEEQLSSSSSHPPDTSSSAPANEDYEDLYDTGLRGYMSGDLNLALKAFEQCRLQDPRDPRVLHFINTISRRLRERN